METSRRRRGDVAGDVAETGARSDVVSRGRPSESRRRVARARSAGPGTPRGVRHRSRGVVALLLLAASAALLVASCAEAGHSARGELDGGLARWDDLGLSSYSFEYRAECDCAEPEPRVAMIVVRDGEVDAVSLIDGGTPAFEPDRYPTVDALFDRLHRALEREPRSVRVEYHPLLGHPTTARVDYGGKEAESWTFEVADLLPLATEVGRTATARD